MSRIVVVAKAFLEGATRIKSKRIIQPGNRWQDLLACNQPVGNVQFRKELIGSGIPWHSLSDSTNLFAKIFAEHPFTSVKAIIF